MLVHLADGHQSSGSVDSGDDAGPTPVEPMEEPESEIGILQALHLQGP